MVVGDSDAKAEPSGASAQKPAQAEPQKKLTTNDASPLSVSEEQRFNEAMQLVKQQRLQEAKTILIELVHGGSHNADVFRWLGDVHYNLMELPEAMEAYKQARNLNPGDYFAMRGLGLSSLHYGHQLHKAKKQEDAHNYYRNALELLQQCLRSYPGDLEAMYGRAMAAEGASRLLYVNALTKLSQSGQAEAEPPARNCLEVIDEGISAANFRIQKKTNEVGPRLLSGGLYLRRACLLKKFGRNEDAVSDIQNAIQTYESILQGSGGQPGVDPNNAMAMQQLKQCRSYLSQWQSGN